MSGSCALALILAALVLGTFSSAVFLWEWVVGAPTPLSALILLISITGVFIKVFLVLKRRIPRLQVASVRHWIFRLLPAACMLIGLACSGIAVVRQARQEPNGEWDAFAVWNLHARFLYRGSEGAWKGIFAPVTWSNGGYPLLLPGVVNGAWTLVGGERPIIPALLAIGFGALSIGIVWSGVSALARDERGWLSGLLLLGTPSFLHLIPDQTADIPIALYMLATVALLQFAEAWREVRRPMLVLAGLSAGFAAWTKNEGLLFVVAVLGSRLSILALLRHWRDLRTNLTMIGLGLAPVLALLISFKIFLTPGNNPIQTIGHASSAGRYWEILLGFYDTAKGFGGTWGGGIHPILLLGLFLLLYARPLRNLRPMSISLALVVPAMLGGYFLVYLFSSDGNLHDYIGGTLNRLCIQLWPASVFLLATFFLPTSTAPENEIK
jgi:dolichyl-phosphate-mannose-protein mannosyltransferase